jgi:Holliday junction resolvase RusA-like endonuclease
VLSVRKRLTDADGVSAKYAIDALIKAGILIDDSPQYVKEVSFGQEKGKNEKTIIFITEN